MDQETIIELRDGYIYVESFGIETQARTTTMFTAIIEKVIEWQCDRVLYIENFINQIPLSDMLSLLEQLFKKVEEEKINVRLAIYDSNINDQDINMLASYLAGTRGIHVKIFLSPEQAIDWLKS